MKYDIEQLLEAGEVIQIYPEGYSMYPMFVPGRDAAVIKKADVKKIRRADVVLYRRKGSILVLHRVVKRKGGQFYMAAGFIMGSDLADTLTAWFQGQSGSVISMGLLIGAVVAAALYAVSLVMMLRIVSKYEVRV